MMLCRRGTKPYMGGMTMPLGGGDEAKKAWSWGDMGMGIMGGDMGEMPNWAEGGGEAMP